MNIDQISLKDILDLDELNSLFSSFSAATGFTTGLVDQKTHEVLIATGWRDICTNFHRKHPEAEKHCLLSNVELTTDLTHMGEIRISKCGNGLVDGCTPIFFQGRHLANLFTGQVLFSPPDIQYFKQQAQIYGFDEQAYLHSVAEVPVVSEERFISILNYLAHLAIMIIQLGVSRFEAQLQASEKGSHLESVFNSVPTGICFVLDRIMQQANPQMVEISGYPQHELIGQSTRMLYPDDELYEQVGREVSSQFNAGGIFSFDTIMQKKNGTLIDVRMQSAPVDKNDPSKGELATVVDLTQLKNVERALQASEFRLNEAQKVAKIGSWEFDLSLDRLSWSDEIYRIFDIQADLYEISFELFLDFVHPDDREAVNRAYTDHLENKQPYSIEHRLLLKNGTIKHVHEKCQTEYDDDGNALRSLGTVQDVTIRKIAELELEKSCHELEERVIERTSDLKTSNLRMQKEIRDRMQSESELYKSEISLERERATLEEANITLKVLMRRIEQDKNEFEEQVAANIFGLVDPYLDKLKRTGLDKRQENYLQIIKANLENIVSPFIKTAVAMDLKLTPTELRVANLIKKDKSSKEIAELLSLSKQTIDKHRNNIRRKIGITNKKVNLKTLLVSSFKTS